jgi:TRL-like protein family
MKHFIKAATVLGFGVSLGACGFAASPVKGKNAGGASIYSDVQFNEKATDNALGGKRGESCTSDILGIIASGDASAATAAKQAGITKIASVDATASNILFFYGTYCIVVTGE